MLTTEGTSIVRKAHRLLRLIKVVRSFSTAFGSYWRKLSGLGSNLSGTLGHLGDLVGEATVC